MSIDDTNTTSPRCWMCGKLADPGCDARLILNAPASSHLDGLGFSVDRGKQLDKVRVDMPRCARCRSWVNDWIVLLFVAIVGGAIAGAAVQSFILPHVEPPAWLKVGHYRRDGIGNSGAAIGLVLGCVGAILGMAWDRVRSKRRSANTYPPIVSLRQLGWSFVSD
jgi:hypothetical protein